METDTSAAHHATMTATIHITLYCSFDVLSFFPSLLEVAERLLGSIPQICEVEGRLRRPRRPLEFLGPGIAILDGTVSSQFRQR
jgi:hypothetical protein